MRKLVIGLALVVLLCTNAKAFSVLNKVPAVTGTVADQDGTPREGVDVTVRFLGTNDKMLDDEKEVYVIKELTAVTDKNGQFQLEGCYINLLKLKAKFIAAEIEFKAEGYNTQKIQAINMRALGGAVGVFIIGLIDAQGEFDGNGPGFFGSMAHAYKTVKDSKFSRVYKALFTETITLKKENGESRRTEQFEGLYK